MVLSVTHTASAPTATRSEVPPNTVQPTLPEVKFNHAIPLPLGELSVVIHSRPKPSAKSAGTKSSGIVSAMVLVAGSRRNTRKSALGSAPGGSLGSTSIALTHTLLASATIFSRWLLVITMVATRALVAGSRRNTRALVGALANANV